MDLEGRVNGHDVELKELREHFNVSCERRADKHNKNLDDHVEKHDRDIIILHERINRQWLQGAIAWFVMLMIFFGGIGWVSAKLTTDETSDIALQMDIADTHKDVEINKVNLQNLGKSMDRLIDTMDEHIKEIRLERGNAQGKRPKD